MVKTIKIIFISIIFTFVNFLNLSADNGNNLKIGNENAKVTIKVFSSLTCPHCANFHEKIFKELKKDYIDTNKVKFEHHSFPLDLAALNAEKILRCVTDKEKRFEFLSAIYKKQKKWAVGSDINVINNSIKEIGREFGLNNKNMDNCLSDEKVQDEILNERINAQKNYKISSTPTIYINKKKYKGDHEYKFFKKELDKLV